MSYPPHIQALIDKAAAIGIGEAAARFAVELMPPGGIERAGPCPHHADSKDTFSINTAKNVWRCRRCDEAGRDAISFYIHVTGASFYEAIEALTGERIEDVKRESAEDRERRQRKLAAARRKADDEAKRWAAYAERQREEARRDGYRIWNEGRRVDWHDHGDPVIAYLRARGIDTEQIRRNTGGGGVQLRLHENLAYSAKVGKGWQVVHTGPAMLAAMVRADGTFGGVHRTWIDLDNAPKFKARIPDPNAEGETLDPKKMRGSKRTAAIPLFTPQGAERIVGGEGIETTLTIMAIGLAEGPNAPPWFDNKTAFWALCDVGHMAGRALVSPEGKRLTDIPDPEDTDAFLPPEWCRELVYLGDADQGDDRARRKIHDELTRGCRRAQDARPGLVAKIAWAAAGQDFNDMAGGGMMQADLLDFMHSPAIRLPVDPYGHVVTKPDETLHLPYAGKRCGDRARIQLHRHSDGLWMWSVSFHTSSHGGGYCVGAKWGQFAETRDDALFHATKELGDGLSADDGPDAAEIIAWARGLS